MATRRFGVVAVAAIASAGLAVVAAVSIAVGAIAPPTAVPLPSDKQARMDAQIAAMASAAAGGFSKDAPVDLPSQTDPPPDFTGSTVAGDGHLFVTSIHPGPDADEAVTTAWEDFTATSRLTVWAGSFVSNPSQGFVEFVEFDGQGHQLRAARVLMPAGAGAATITGATGDVVDLMDEAGTRFTFAPTGAGLAVAP